MKITHKLINSFFQMSSVDVQYLQFDVKTRIVSFAIISTTCAFPMIIASATLISFERKGESTFGLKMDNLSYSSFVKFVEDFQELEVGKEYTLQMLHDDGRYYKFFYLVCPFYVDPEMETVIQMASILSTEDVNVIDQENNLKYPVDFDSNLALDKFIENALLNIQVKKVYLDSLMAKDGVNQFLVDFTSTSKYFLFINKPRMVFKISSKEQIYYKIIKIDEEGEARLIEKKTKEVLRFHISSEDHDSGFYIYIQNILSAENIELYLETFDVIEPENKSFFYNFWGYFILVLGSIISLIVIWIIVQRFMNKKRLQKIQKELDGKLREQHSLEIQKQSERISVILMSERDSRKSNGRGFREKGSQKGKKGKHGHRDKDRDTGESESEDNSKDDLETSREEDEDDQEKEKKEEKVFRKVSRGSRQSKSTCSSRKSQQSMKSKGSKQSVDRKMRKRLTKGREDELSRQDSESKISRKGSCVKKSGSKKSSFGKMHSKNDDRLQTKVSNFAKVKTFKNKIISSIENLIVEKQTSQDSNPKKASKVKLDPYKFTVKSKRMYQRKKKNTKKPTKINSSPGPKQGLMKMSSMHPKNSKKEERDFKSQFTTIDVRSNN
jgi:hypothetical protein